MILERKQKYRNTINRQWLSENKQPIRWLKRIHREIIIWRNHDILPWGRECPSGRSSGRAGCAWSRRRPRGRRGWRACPGWCSRTWRSPRWGGWGARSRWAGVCSGWFGCWVCRSSWAGAASLPSWGWLFCSTILLRRIAPVGFSAREFKLD